MIEVSKVSKARDKREKGYHKLLLWQRFKEFIKLVYFLTEKLPKDEEFGLKPQMKRAIVSVISNFVEGYLKTSMKEKIRFNEIAKTSLQELEAQGEICLILGYWTMDDYDRFDEKRGEVAYLLFRYTAQIK
ncbi:four helix bundle protein [Candidatus Gottesmanbacteria bacterium]|nr:four helix bundle protein [Candidatus Gottesmanbacteria bacterium]MBI5451997.1 four helix bundle protein [Candidatus Gottesmanbacteria bacterium]